MQSLQCYLEAAGTVVGHSLYLSRGSHKWLEKRKRSGLAKRAPRKKDIRPAGRCPEQGIKVHSEGSLAIVGLP